MKSGWVFISGLATVMLAPAISSAQQTPARVRGVTMRPQVSAQPSEIETKRVESRGGGSGQTFQVIDFTFWTGGDDLRDDSVVTASLTFPDGARQDCHLHGAAASGAAANISWDNNSTHDAPPCRLDKLRSLAELKKTRMVISLYGPAYMPGAADVAETLGTATVLYRSQDNWNINRVVVRANNPESHGQACVFSVSDNPLARLKGDQPEVTISDFPNQCR